MLPRRLLGPQGNTAVGRMMACIEHLCAAQICLSTGNHLPPFWPVPVAGHDLSIAALYCLSPVSLSQCLLHTIAGLHCGHFRFPVLVASNPCGAGNISPRDVWRAPRLSLQDATTLSPTCRRCILDELEALFRFTDDEAGPDAHSGQCPRYLSGG